MKNRMAPNILVGSYKTLKNEPDFTAVEEEYRQEDSRMLKEGYILIETETNRHEEDVKKLTDIFQRHFPEWDNKNPERGVILTHTLSERIYQNTEGKKKKITFLERTREECCLVNYFFRPTEVIKKIQQNL